MALRLHRLDAGVCVASWIAPAALSTNRLLLDYSGVCSDCAAIKRPNMALLLLLEYVLFGLIGIP
jgi:hypothetical protein